MHEHISVLAKEVIEGMSLAPGMTVLDGTLGLGGHARLMLEITAPQGRVFGFDRDDRNLALAKERLAGFGDRVTFVNDSFAHVSQYEVPVLDGALLDLGFSSLHVDDPSRGFSFMKDGPLDMRYDTRQEMSAETIVNSWSRDDLAYIFRLYGEERFASGIAKAITESRKKERITTTGQLATLISSLAGRRTPGVHPATRVFQALRIAVNDELGELERGLRDITAKLQPGARFAVITFHSLEDRIVKQFFADNDALDKATKKPIVPSEQELSDNPRSRSAKLRIAIKK